jgi:hypothetical protein
MAAVGIYERMTTVLHFLMLALRIFCARLQKIVISLLMLLPLGVKCGQQFLIHRTVDESLSFSGIELFDINKYYICNT